MPEHQDSGLDNVQQIARGLRRDREDVGESVGELRESVTELRTRREPTATVELTEDELAYLVEAVDERGFRELHDRPESGTAFDKLRQALAIESGPGGNFDDGPVAA